MNKFNFTICILYNMQLCIFELLAILNVPITDVLHGAIKQYLLPIF